MSARLQKQMCYHCGNDVGRAPVISEDRVYCCEGCKTVSNIIFSNGKSKFYKIKGNVSFSPVTEAIQQDYAFLDSEEVMSKYSSNYDNGQKEVQLNIDNLHCSACVWLIESSLSELPGVSEARISLSTGKARIRFSEMTTRLSIIMNTIHMLGYNPNLTGAGSSKDKKSIYPARIAVAAFSAANLMLISASLYLGFFTGMEAGFKNLFHYLSWVLATPVYLYSGSVFFRGAISSLRARKPHMDLLVFIGVSMAYLYSIWVTLTEKGEVYFDSVCLIYLIVLTGKFLEEKARNKAREKLETMVSGLPESAIWIDKDGKEQKISAEKILKNHKLKLLPGMRLPVDAIIMDYSVNIDESVLTGESEPTLKHQGDTIYAGSISVESPVICVALNSYHESSLSSLKKRLENLSFEKSNLQVFTEKLSHAFLYIVLIIAAGSFAYWYFSTGSLEQAITTAVAVLIVACPCALGIAVPAALVTNHILNSEKGILLKNPSVVDSLDKATVFCFDKTGTLTEGKMKVVGEFLPKDVSLEAIYLAAKQSNHPASRAVAEYLEKKVNKNYIPFFSIVNTKNNTGMGTCTLVHTSWGQVEVKLGNSKHCHIDSISEKAVYFSMREKKGYFILEEKVRENAKTLIDNLKKKNKKIIMLSGDSKDSVEKVAKELGIENYYFDMKPEDKVKIIDDLNSKGERPAMVGDGLNDTLSLTKAGVGITHGLAEDLSLEKSDVILIRPEMENLIKALDYSKLTRRVVRENIAISLTYNSIMIPLAAFGLMLPVICAAFMSTSSLTVLTNSILLYRRAKKI